MVTVYTIGHSNLSFERFFELIDDAEINGLVDVRSVPYNRFYHQFDREKLMQLLNANGIAYYYEGEQLGGRITDVECYKTKSLPNRKANIAELIDYEELIRRPWFIQGIMKVEELAEKHNLAVMCSEENPQRCHRNLLIARNLVERGNKVLHIRSNGNLEEASIAVEYVQLKLI